MQENIPKCDHENITFSPDANLYECSACGELLKQMPMSIEAQDKVLKHYLETLNDDFEDILQKYLAILSKKTKSKGTNETLTKAYYEAKGSLLQKIAMVETADHIINTILQRDIS